MGKRARFRTRALNFRLWGSREDGSEVLRDFATSSEACEADRSDLVNWVVFVIDDDLVAGCVGPTILSSDGEE